MSILRKISTFDKLLIKNGFLTISASYSRRSREERQSNYKVVRNKSNVRERKTRFYQEGEPNWEIFNPHGSRFYLPNSSGPGWLHPNSTIDVDVELENLVDFDSLKPNKFHISVIKCPVLMFKNLQDLFILEAFNEKSKLNIIILAYTKDQEVETSAKNFVIAAREICDRLHRQGHWADFMNPFSGTPFYYRFTDSKMAQLDKRFRGFGVKFEDKNNCTVITADVEGAFSGCIFTDAPDNKGDLKWSIKFHEYFVNKEEERSFFDDY